MTFERLFKGIAIASLLIIFSEAVLSCTLVEGSADRVRAEAVATLRLYHWPAVTLGIGVLGLFLLRRFRGLVILLFAAASLAVSPGWSPDANALPLPNCEPRGAFGVKAVLGITLVCFVVQLAFLIIERRKSQDQ